MFNHIDSNNTIDVIGTAAREAEIRWWDLEYDYIDRDLSAEDIAISTRSSDPGTPVYELDTKTLYVGAIIKNNSDNGCSNYEVEFQIDGGVIGTETVGPIQGGESKWVYTEWTNVPSSLTPFTVSAMVDPDDDYPDEPDDNNYAEADYTYYYADCGTEPFNHAPDTYGQFNNSDVGFELDAYELEFDDFFENDWGEYADALYDQALITVFALLNGTTPAVFSQGLCWGIATTVDGYYTGDITKPDPADVFDYSWETARDNVLRYHLTQFDGYLDDFQAGLSGDWSASDTYDTLRQVTGLGGKPSVLTLVLKWNDSGPGHSALINKVIEHDGMAFAYVYDPNATLDSESPSVFCYKDGDWYLDANAAPSSYSPVHDRPINDPTDSSYSTLFGFPYAGYEEVDTAMKAYDFFESRDGDEFIDNASALLSLWIRYMNGEGQHVIMTDDAAQLGVIDGSGRRSGYIDGVLYDEIPDSFLFEADNVEMLLVPDSLDYDIHLNSNAEDDLVVNIIEHLSGMDATLVNWHEVPITTTTEATIDFSQSRDSFTMAVDYDGDGDFEDYIDPDYEDQVTDISDATIYISPKDEGILLGWSVNGGIPASVRVLRGEDEPVAVSGSLDGSTSRWLDREVEPGGSYVYWLEATDNAGQVQRYGPTAAVVVPEQVQRLALEEPYPNPADNSVSVAFTLSEAQRVSLSVYDLAGRRVTTLSEGELPAGRHEVAWNCAAASAGVYLLWLETEGEALSRRMVVGR